MVIGVCGRGIAGLLNRGVGSILGSREGDETEPVPALIALNDLSWGGAFKRRSTA